MTVSVKDIRVKISPAMINAYVAKKGIDTRFMPFDIKENIYDVRFQTSDKSSVPDERCTMDDINKELERFKVIADRVRDSPLYVKSFDKQKVGMAFETDEDSTALDSIDEVRKNATKIEADVPKAKDRFRWYDS